MVRAPSEAIYRRRRATAVVVMVALVVLAGACIREASARDVASSRKASGRNSAAPAVTGAGQPVDAAAFGSGACMSFPPTSGDRHLTVFLDAGHGGIDPGGVGTAQDGQQVEEAHLTLPVELDAMADLRRDGFTVVVSRTADTTVTRLGSGDISGGVLSIQGAHDDVAARAICANDAGASLLVGIYFDAGASPTNAGAVTGYDAVRPFASSNLRFAQLLQTDVLGAMNARGWDIPDEGVLLDDYLGSAQSNAAVSYGHLMLLGPAEPGYFDTPSQMPGALIEPLFVTDPFEATIASGASGQQVIAGGIADAVNQYFTPAPAAAG